MITPQNGTLVNGLRQHRFPPRGRAAASPEIAVCKSQSLFEQAGHETEESPFRRHAMRTPTCALTCETSLGVDRHGIVIGSIATERCCPSVWTTIPEGVVAPLGRFSAWFRTGVVTTVTLGGLTDCAMTRGSWPYSIAELHTSLGGSGDGGQLADQIECSGWDGWVLREYTLGPGFHRIALQCRGSVTADGGWGHAYGAFTIAPLRVPASIGRAALARALPARDLRPGVRTRVPAA